MAKRGTIPFEKRQNILKAETDRALQDPGWLYDLMGCHANGDPDPTGKLQIRVMGPIEEVIEMVNKILDIVPDTKVGLTKMEKDKKDRCGNYSARNIRAYLNPF